MEDNLKKLEEEIKNNEEVKEQLLKELIDVKKQEFDNEKINEVVDVLESVIDIVFSLVTATSKINVMVTQVSKSVSLVMNSHTNTTTPAILSIQERLGVVEEELGLYIDDEEEDKEEVSEFNKAWDAYLDTLDFSDPSLSYQDEWDSFSKRWEEEND